MRTIPVIAHETGDEQFGTERIGFSQGQCVMEEQRVSNRPVDDAVENMSQQLALENIKNPLTGNGKGTYH